MYFKKNKSDLGGGIVYISFETPKPKFKLSKQANSKYASKLPDTTAAVCQYLISDNRLPLVSKESTVQSANFKRTQSYLLLGKIT